MSRRDSTTETIVHLQPEDPYRLASLCGQYNEHLQQIERQTGVVIHQRGHVFGLSGGRASVRHAEHVLSDLYRQTSGKRIVTPDAVHLRLQQNSSRSAPAGLTDESATAASVLAARRRVDARSDRQHEYIQAMRERDLVLAVGPAGTGKTFLAVACAIEALQAGQVERVVLVRPVVEAGEKLGFLPGDLAQKVDPYLRPMQDALDELLDAAKISRLMEQRVIEIAPLAYMRGRTLNKAFIILDEGQNTTIEQMKMLLTRIGFGSKAVVTGDLTQVDLPPEVPSGLRHAVSLLADHVPDIAVIRFQVADALRHPLVRKIVMAYQDRGDSVTDALRHEHRKMRKLKNGPNAGGQTANRLGLPDGQTEKYDDRIAE